MSTSSHEIQQGPRAADHTDRPERIAAAVVAVTITGFNAWVMATLPLQAAAILVAAAWVAFAAG